MGERKRGEGKERRDKEPPEGAALLLSSVEVEGGQREGRGGRGGLQRADKFAALLSRSVEGRRRGSVLLVIEIGASTIVFFFCLLVSSKVRNYVADFAVTFFGMEIFG